MGKGQLIRVGRGRYMLPEAEHSENLGLALVAAALPMARDKPRNTSASIRQRLLNHSTAIKTDPNLVLIWYGLERFLYRLSVSTHSERFVLKGAMLFRLWGDANVRSTKDLDLEGFLQVEAEAGPHRCARIVIHRFSNQHWGRERAPK